jgi:hypothetical protein
MATFSLKDEMDFKHEQSRFNDDYAKFKQDYAKMKEQGYSDLYEKK